MWRLIWECYGNKNVNVSEQSLIFHSFVHERMRVHNKANADIVERNFQVNIFVQRARNKGYTIAAKRN
jgi:predicted sugar kinase